MAPANDRLDPTDVPSLLEWADVVGVFLDASRISAGLRDLWDAPYIAELKKEQHRDKLLLLCEDGALLPRWPAVAQEEIVPLLRGLDKDLRVEWLALRPWFLFEEYRVLQAGPLEATAQASERKVSEEKK